MHAWLLAALLTAGKIDGVVRSVMHAQHVAGLSLGIVHDGEAVYRRGYGWADLGRRTPADADTVYRIGSLTKSFTAGAVLALQSRGMLALQESAAKYLSPFPWPASVTIGELLAQTSGIPSYSDTALDRTRAYAPQQLVDAVADRPLLFPPGTNFAYSNTNYVLLGMIVERRSGMPFGSFLDSAVLVPQDLTHTRYGDAAVEARGYARDRLNLPVPRSSVSFAFSAAGMTSSVPDLLRWLQSLQEPYYGLLAGNFYGYAVEYATGNVDGYSAFEVIAPAQRDAIVILTNADALDLAPLAKSVFAAVEPPKPETYAHGFSPPQNEDPRVTAQLQRVLADLQSGTVDRSLLAAGYSASLSQPEIDRLRAMLSPHGGIVAMEFLGRQPLQDGSLVRYRVSFSDGARLIAAVRYTAAGAIAGISLSQ